MADSGDDVTAEQINEPFLLAVLRRHLMEAMERPLEGYRVSILYPEPGWLRVRREWLP